MPVFADTVRRWRQRRVPLSMDPVHAASIQRTLALTRAVLGTIGVAAVWLDPSDPPRFAGIAAFLLVGFAVYAAVILVIGSRHTAWLMRQWVRIHVIDLAWVLIVTSFTGGISSPFYAFYIYALLAAGFRWGFFATMMTALCSTVVALAQVAAGLIGVTGGEVPLNLGVLRPAFILVGGVLIGLLAEEGHRQRTAASAVARIMGLVRMEGGLVASVEAILSDLLERFGAAHAVLALEEEGSERVFLWELSRDAPTGQRRMRPFYLDRMDARMYLFPIPAGADAWYAERAADAAGADRAEVVVLDASGTRARVLPSIQPLLSAAFGWRNVHCVSSIAGAGWSGRLFIFDGMAFRKIEDELRFLQVVIREVAPALFNLYLQRRLRSRAGTADRARVARELHDGVIQTLIGLEMQLDVVRRQADGSLSPAARDQLASIQQALGEEAHNVRDLMDLLRPRHVDASRLVEHLANLVERFGHRSGIHARFISDVDTIPLPPRTCQEVAGAVQEALANVRKHSGAANVLVRVSATAAGWQFLVDDDGKGFEFEGRLTHDELDRHHWGPVILKERVRSAGGSVAIHSEPGRGSRIEMLIPR